MDQLTPHVTSQSVYIPSKFPQSANYHVIFITGNPGCIGYYHSFLSILGKGLWREAIDFYGHSLANFVDEVQGADKVEAPREILNLQGQILYMEELLQHYVESVIRNAGTKGEVKHPKIIIIGHSVGAYIGLEIMRRWREKGTKAESEKMRVVGFIGLWPTITWIGKSPNGIRLGWVSRLPFLPKLVAILAWLMTVMLPRLVLYRIVKLFTGMTDKGAKVTTEFLCSTHGVEQALYMGRDELLQITEDRWDQSLWGSAAPMAMTSTPNPKLIFYFGKRDHWVADHSRDELIAARAYQDGGGEDWKPQMLIDDEEIPHNFCIHHNLTVAKKVEGFIEEIIGADRAQCGS